MKGVKKRMSMMFTQQSGMHAAETLDREQAWCPDPLEGWVLRNIVTQQENKCVVEPLSEEESKTPDWTK